MEVTSPWRVRPYNRTPEIFLRQVQQAINRILEENNDYYSQDSDGYEYDDFIAEAIRLNMYLDSAIRMTTFNRTRLELTSATGQSVHETINKCEMGEDHLPNSLINAYDEQKYAYDNFSLLRKS